MHSYSENCFSSTFLVTIFVRKRETRAANLIDMMTEGKLYPFFCLFSLSYLGKGTARWFSFFHNSLIFLITEGRSKERSRDREREPSRDRDRGESRDRGRDHDRRSRDQDRYHERDRGYDRDRERDYERSRSYDSRSRRRSRSRSREHSRDYDRHRYLLLHRSWFPFIFRHDWTWRILKQLTDSWSYDRMHSNKGVGFVVLELQIMI